MSNMRPFATIHETLKKNETLDSKAGNEVVEEAQK